MCVLMLVCCFVTSCYNKLTINSKVGPDTQNSLTHSSENIKLSLLDHIFNFRTRLDSTPSSSNVSFAVTSLINRKLICCVLQVWIMQICSISKKKITYKGYYFFLLKVFSPSKYSASLHIDLFKTSKAINFIWWKIQVKTIKRLLYYKEIVCKKTGEW